MRHRSHTRLFRMYNISYLATKEPSGQRTPSLGAHLASSRPQLRENTRYLFPQIVIGRSRIASNARSRQEFRTRFRAPRLRTCPSMGLARLPVTSGKNSDYSSRHVKGPPLSPNHSGPASAHNSSLVAGFTFTIAPQKMRAMMDSVVVLTSTVRSFGNRAKVAFVQRFRAQLWDLPAGEVETTAVIKLEIMG